MRLDRSTELGGGIQSDGGAGKSLLLVVSEGDDEIGDHDVGGESRRPTGLLVCGESASATPKSRYLG